MGQNGNTPPSCVLSICVDSTCSPTYSLTTAFATYSLTYNSPSSSNNQAGVFSIQCLGQAYVGLDNVRVDPVFVPQPSPSPASSPVVASATSFAADSAAATSSAAPGISSTPRSSFVRATVRTVTTSIYSVFTTTAYATQTLTQTESTQSYGTVTTQQIQPTTVLTTQIETATSLQNVTVSDVQTSTSMYLQFATIPFRAYHQLFSYSVDGTPSRARRPPFCKLYRRPLWSSASVPPRNSLPLRAD
jgi:hypothetical protein